LIYACDSCHYLFASEDIPDRCKDCGKTTVRTALEEEIQEFLANRHTELWCDAAYLSGRDAVPLPRTRISITGEGVSLVGETDFSGTIKFTKDLAPGVYSAEIIEVPVGFIYGGEKAHFNVLEGETTFVHFLLTEK